MGNWIKLTASDKHQFDGYLAMPSGKPRGGIVVIQEIFGVNRHMRAVTDRFAAAGYAAPEAAEDHGRCVELCEGFGLPRCAELLAEGETFEVQAFRYKRAYALQFHPDVTHAMMHRWTTRGHVRLEMPGAKPRAAHFADREVYDYSVRAWLSIFLERWIGS
jgi:hypothetical protein